MNDLALSGEQSSPIPSPARQACPFEDRQGLAERTVAEALTWLNTPYHHMGKVKGVGVDCGQLLIAVFENTGYLKKDEIQPGYYPPDWHLHREEERYLGWVNSRCREVKEAVAAIRSSMSAAALGHPWPAPGDIALFKFGRCVSHGGIVIEWPNIIHAYIDYGVIISSIYEPLLTGRRGESRLAGVYRPIQ